jgi:hypothetical protein
MGAILEPCAAYDAGRLPRGRELLERLDQLGAIHSTAKTALQSHMRVRRRDRVLIAEEVRDQGNVARAARRRSKSAA